MIIKLSSLHTHWWPTAKKDLLFFFPNIVCPSRSLLSLQFCPAVLASTPAFPRHFPLVDELSRPIALTLLLSAITSPVFPDLPLLHSPGCPVLDHRGRCHQSTRRQVSVQTSLCATAQLWPYGRAQERLDRRTYDQLKRRLEHSLSPFGTHGFRLLRISVNCWPRQITLTTCLQERKRIDHTWIHPQQQ